MVVAYCHSCCSFIVNCFIFTNVEAFNRFFIGYMVWLWYDDLCVFTSPSSYLWWIVGSLAVIPISSCFYIVGSRCNFTCIYFQYVSLQVDIVYHCIFFQRRIIFVYTYFFQKKKNNVLLFHILNCWRFNDINQSI